MKRILFVCTGNICRSPTAEAVARHFVETGGLGAQVLLDSAGTQGYHVGEAPDPRTQKAAKLRGYDLSALRARKLELRDFQEFDLLLAMDRGHLEHMQRHCPEVYRPKLQLFLPFTGRSGTARRCPILTTAGRRASTWCSTCARTGRAGSWSGCGRRRESEGRGLIRAGDERVRPARSQHRANVAAAAPRDWRGRSGGSGDRPARSPVAGAQASAALAARLRSVSLR